MITSIVLTILTVICHVILFTLKASLKALQISVKAGTVTAKVANKTVKASGKAVKATGKAVKKTTDTTKNLADTPINAVRTVTSPKSSKDPVSLKSELNDQKKKLAKGLAVNLAKSPFKAIVALRRLIGLLGIFVRVMFVVLGLVYFMVTSITFLGVVAILACAGGVLLLLNSDGWITTMSIQPSSDKTQSSGDSAWVDCLDEMAQYYVNNIKLYCGTPDASSTARQYYECPLIDDWTITDDCSGYVTASLQLFGVFGELGSSGIYWTGAMFDGTFASTMTSHGFKMYSTQEYTADKLKEGDILLDDDTHVEVFKEWDSNGNGVGWSWGDVYDALPVTRGYSKSSFPYVDGSHYYDHVWSYEGDK